MSARPLTDRLFAILSRRQLTPWVVFIGFRNERLADDTKSIGQGMAFRFHALPSNLTARPRQLIAGSLTCSSRTYQNWHYIYVSRILEGTKPNDG